MPTQSNATPSSDEIARERLIRELDRTFFVDAGAGTGKTTALVQRIVALIAAGALEMESLAAITFTEAAAAELRDRVRRELERTARDTSQSEEVRTRCAKAASEVDLATLQTIHAFAATLLRSFPIEAGLPPSFAVWDEIQTELAFDEQFRRWLHEAWTLEETAHRRETLRRALLLGLSIEEIRELARALQEQRDLLDAETEWDAPRPPDAVALARRLGADLIALEALVPLARHGEDDPLVREIRRLQLPARRLIAARDEIEALEALQRVGRPRLNVGRQSDWDASATTGQPVRQIKDTFRSVRDEIEAALAAHRTATLAALLKHLRDFTLACAEERRRQGAASFHDLLTWTRNLLRDCADVRERAQRRFTHIFVDEFQDTDPLQMEIVWYLGADPDAPPVADWRDLRLVPGKVFLVGDPKQSIYRFRRADISIYEAIAERIAEDDRLDLTRNFRSVPEVIHWVNYHFARDLVEERGIQPRYRPLVPRDVDPPVRGCRGVYRFGDEVDDRMREIWQREANALAVLARQIYHQGWLVRNADDSTRPVRYSDICILLPTRTNMRRLERALEQHGVPYRMESGSLVLATQEVRDLLSCLRAIDDPSDQVALVAALRSPIYGCSDVDLLRWVEAGHPLDYEATMGAAPGAGMEGVSQDSRPPATGRVAEAFASLHRLHEQRAHLSAAALVEELIRERLLTVQAFAYERPREAWRRLRYVVARARDLAAAGRPSLRALVDWLEELQRAEVRDLESPVPEPDEDAVRLLTIHGAKGLEFPVVLLSGLGAKPNARHPRVIADRTTGAIEVRCGAFETTGYAAALATERRMEDAERRRLLYVAATRARDHLVLCLYRNARSGNECNAARIASVLTECDQDLCHALELDEAAFSEREPSPRAVCEAESPEAHAAAEHQWLIRRAERVAASSALHVLNIRNLTHKPRTDENGDGTDGGIAATVTWQPDDESYGDTLIRDDDALALTAAGDDALASNWTDQGATAVGRAIHATLRSLDLPKCGNLRSRATALASAYGVAEQRDLVHDLALAIATSPFVQRAFHEGRHWRDVACAAQVGDVVVEGQVDLVVELPDGSLRIVVFETEPTVEVAVSAEAATYRLRAGAYALIVEQATRRPVRAVEYVFATPHAYSLAYHDVAALISEARAWLVSGPGNA